MPAGSEATSCPHGGTGLSPHPGGATRTLVTAPSPVRCHSKLTPGWECRCLRASEFDANAGFFFFIIFFFPPKELI